MCTNGIRKNQCREATKQTIPKRVNLPCAPSNTPTFHHQAVKGDSQHWKNEIGTAMNASSTRTPILFRQMAVHLSA